MQVTTPINGNIALNGKSTGISVDSLARLLLANPTTREEAEKAIAAARAKAK